MRYKIRWNGNHFHSPCLPCRVFHLSAIPSRRDVFLQCHLTLNQHTATHTLASTRWPVLFQHARAPFVVEVARSVDVSSPRLLACVNADVSRLGPKNKLLGSPSAIPFQHAGCRDWTPHYLGSGLTTLEFGSVKGFLSFVRERCSMVRMEVR